MKLPLVPHASNFLVSKVPFYRFLRTVVKALNKQADCGYRPPFFIYPSQLHLEPPDDVECWERLRLLALAKGWLVTSLAGPASCPELLVFTPNFMREFTVSKSEHNDEVLGRLTSAFARQGIELHASNHNILTFRNLFLPIIESLISDDKIDNLFIEAACIAAEEIEAVPLPLESWLESIGSFLREKALNGWAVLTIEGPLSEPDALDNALAFCRDFGWQIAKVSRGDNSGHVHFILFVAREMETLRISRDDFNPYILSEEKKEAMFKALSEEGFYLRSESTSFFLFANGLSEQERAAVHVSGVKIPEEISISIRSGDNLLLSQDKRSVIVKAMETQGYHLASQSEDVLSFRETG
jgi:hypothetical protein